MACDPHHCRHWHPVIPQKQHPFEGLEICTHSFGGMVYLPLDLLWVVSPERLISTTFFLCVSVLPISRIVPAVGIITPNPSWYASRSRLMVGPFDPVSHSMSNDVSTPSCLYASAVMRSICLILTRLASPGWE